MQKTKILWSGIKGRTGVQALNAATNSKYSEIVAGISRNDNKYYNYSQLDEISQKFDVIVDFSHKDSFDTILAFALKENKPLISGTSDITEEQLTKLEEASKIIPIFRGGNFRFAVEEFINAVVEFAKENDNIKIVETHYKTKKIPSETAKVIAKRVFEKTGKIVEIESHLEYDDLINDWRVGHLHCRVEGFEQLGKDVLQIADMMSNQKPDGLYDLNRLLNKDKDNIVKENSI